MSVLSYAQKIGQALMVPVAALPAAALLMEIGYWGDRLLARPGRLGSK